MARGWTDFLSLRRWGWVSGCGMSGRSRGRNMGENTVSAEIPTKWLNSPFDFVWSLGAVFSHFSSPRKRQRYPHDKTVLVPGNRLLFQKKVFFIVCIFSIPVADTGEAELSSSPNLFLLDSNRQHFFLRLWKALVQHNSWLHN